MPRQRSPERDKARELYVQSKGELQLNEIADRLNVSEGTVRGWKAKDNWDMKSSGTPKSKKNTERSEKIRSVPNDNKERSEQGKNISTNKSTKKSASKIAENTESGATAETNLKKRGAQPGNKNAAGNKGGLGGPIRNKFAIKTHEYATVFFSADLIDDEERAILDADYDKYVQQLLLIDTLKIREKRILQEIRKVKETPGGMIIDSVTKQKGSNTTSYINRNKSGEAWDGNSTTEAVDTATHVAEPELKRRMQLDEALGRTQKSLQKALEVWHKMEKDDERAEIDRAKLKLQRQRISGQIDLDELIDDDDLGFGLDLDLDE